MEEVELKVIEAKFQAVLQQRDQANNQVINMMGELARKQHHIDELEKQVQDLTNKAEECQAT